MEAVDVFRLELHCTSDPTLTEHKTVEFNESPPITARDLKLKIEEATEIPEFLLKLEYNWATLRDDNLERLNVRNGDTFVVHYFSKADCKEILDCIKWLEQLLESIKRWKESDYSAALNYPRKEDCLENLGFNLFLPWLEPQKYANKLYFIAKDGLNQVIDALNILLDVSSLPYELSLIEGRLLVILWNITEDAHIRRALVEAGGVQTCTKALLRVPVVPPTYSIGLSFYVKQTMRKSLGIFAK